MPSSNLNIGSKNLLLIRLICFFWLIGKIISWKLWLSDRLFPVVPAFEFLVVPSMVHFILFIFSVSALIILLIYPANKALQISLLLIEILTCLLDQNRWQPWEYQYFFMILILLFNQKKEKNISSVIGFMIAAIYIYSGIGKINPAFLQSIWYRTILVQLLHVGSKTAHDLFVYHAGYLMGLIEIILGAGLFFQRTKKLSGILIIVMHLLILIIFGPLGLNYDLIVWPWNIAMMCFVFVLILQDKNFNISFRSLKYGWNKSIVILFGVLPILSLFNCWDFFFSSSLFSARPPDMYICMKNDAAAKIFQPYRIPYQGALICDSNSCLINVRGWAFREMTAPGNPEERIYKSIKKQMQKTYPKLNATYFVFSYKNGKKIMEQLK